MIPTKRYAIILASCLSLLIAAGCGFKSDPSPISSSDLFRWDSVKAEAIDPCVKVTAKLAGNIRDVSKIVIEVQKAGEQADCPDCPFSADEEFEFSPSELSLLVNSGKFEARFCPTQVSNMYRWKMKAKSRYFGMPDATTRERFIQMP